METQQEILVQKLAEAKEIIKRYDLKTYSFEFAGSTYIVEAPEKQNIITINGKKTII